MHEVPFLAGIEFRETKQPGISIHTYSHDKDTGRAAVLIRMEPGCGYPAHRHRGTEDVLVVQGAYQDSQGIHRAGDFVHYPDGSSHAPIACGGDEVNGQACVLFAITERGIERSE